MYKNYNIGVKLKLTKHIEKYYIYKNLKNEASFFFYINGCFNSNTHFMY